MMISTSLWQTTANAYYRRNWANWNGMKLDGIRNGLRERSLGDYLDIVLLTGRAVGRW